MRQNDAAGYGQPGAVEDLRREVLREQFETNVFGTVELTNRIIPGVLPITDYPALVRFCSLCGASISQEVHDIFKPIAEDKEKTLKAGIDFCLKQSKALLAGGAPGLHFYTLNKTHPVDTILNELRP